MAIRTKVVAGPNGSEVIELTAEENAARDIEEQAWTDGATVRAAEAELSRLEGTVTPRRLRDALNDPTWVNAVEAEIAVQRAIIVGG